MKRRKPPGGPPTGLAPLSWFGRNSGAPRPPGWDQLFSQPPPRDGDPAPSGTGGIDFDAVGERAARTEWQAAHTAWLTVNHLTATHADMDAWWSHPDRDRLPMPGVIEWQKRISEQYGRNPGYYPQPLDARAAQQIEYLRQENQALRQARQGDAARLTWLEDQFARIADALSASDAKRSELARYIDQRDQWLSEQAAAIAKQKEEISQLTTANTQQQRQIERARTETARLEAEITDKDTANGRLKESTAQLETMIRNLRYDVQSKDAAIRILETARKALPPADTGAELALLNHQQVAAWKDDLIAALTAENLELRALIARLSQRNARLTGLGTGDGTSELPSISTSVDSP